MVLERSALGKLAPIGAVSFLCNGVKQKDLAESGLPVSNLPYCFASNNLK